MHCSALLLCDRSGELLLKNVRKRSLSESNESVRSAEACNGAPD